MQQTRARAKGVKRLAEPLEHRPGLRIGIAGAIARGQAPSAPRDPRAHGAALGVGQAPPRETLPQRLEFDCTQGALQPEEAAIMRSAGIVHPVLSGEEGATQGAPCAHMLPVFGAARQPTPRSPQDEADMVHGALGEEPLAPLPILGRRAALSLRLVHDQPADRGPAQRDGIVA